MTTPTPTLALGPPRLRPWPPVPVVDAVVVPDLAGCPQCTGRWMRSLTFDHANTCSLRDQQDATADSDATYFRTVGTSTRVRPATSAEKALGTALGLVVPADADTVTRLFSPGFAMAVRFGPVELARLATAAEVNAALAVTT